MTTAHTGGPGASNRRGFLKGVAGAGALFTIAGTKASGRVIGANDTIRVGVAGLHGRGAEHVDQYCTLPGVQVTYLIDPDLRTFKDRVATVQLKGNNTPKTVLDVRRALEDRELDAISIATPNHWHSLMTLWGCQAGKDVYVEKPLSHDVHEGRVAVEAARKYGRIVQHGTQGRSSARWAQVAEIARAGTLGKLKVSRGLCYKPRPPIGFKEDAPIPAELDYSLWLGPAHDQPFNANYVHYNWHWFWEFGNGDIGNQGVHQMDIARWMIPDATLPRSVLSVGGRFGAPDQGQTANTMVTAFDYGDTTLIFEVRGLKTDRYRDELVGNILHFEGGTVTDRAFFPEGKDEPADLPKVEAKRGPGAGNHFANFIAAVKARRPEDLNADVLEGHYSSSLCHLANISFRLGQVDPSQVDHPDLTPELGEAYGRMREHLLANDLSEQIAAMQFGRRLTFDPRTERFVNDRQADAMLTRSYRAPFTVPERLS